MTDKIKKFLHKLNRRQLTYLLSYIEKVESNAIEGLNIKPLKGYERHFRVRAGKYRIIFTRHDHRNQVIAITRRDDQTYRDF